ncbi:MAG: hypothetical protein ABIB71_00350 [Candidatus Woesearchaeota archaeon]
MKKTLLTGLMFGLMGLAEPASAEEPVNQDGVSLNFSLDAYSKYVSRGFVFSDKPVIQPLISATYKNFSLIGFWNVDAGEMETNETDLIIDYTDSIGEELTLSAGYGVFAFFGENAFTTQEIYVQATLEELLRPSLKLHYDFGEGNGIYSEFSLSHDFSFDKFGISASAILAYNHNYFREGSGFSHLEFKIAMPIELTKNISLCPKIAFLKALDEEDFKDVIYYGAGLNISI